MIKNHIVYNPGVEWKFDLKKAEGDCIQLMPPLTIKENMLMQGLDILIKVIKI